MNLAEHLNSSDTAHFHNRRPQVNTKRAAPRELLLFLCRSQRLGPSPTTHTTLPALLDLYVGGLCNWVLLGFPHYQSIHPTLQDNLKLTLQWLFPPHLKTHRSNQTIWSCAFCLAWALHLSHIWRLHHKKHHYRVFLRAFASNLQHSILHNRTDTHWRTYVYTIYSALTSQHTLNKHAHLAALYIASSTHSSTWYIGKSNVPAITKNTNSLVPCFAFASTLPAPLSLLPPRLTDPATSPGPLSLCTLSHLFPASFLTFSPS